MSALTATSRTSAGVVGARGVGAGGGSHTSVVPLGELVLTNPPGAPAQHHSAIRSPVVIGTRVVNTVVAPAGGVTVAEWPISAFARRIWRRAGVVASPAVTCQRVITPLLGATAPVGASVQPSALQVRVLSGGGSAPIVVSARAGAAADSTTATQTSTTHRICRPYAILAPEC